jgi:hypothetical protein
MIRDDEAVHTSETSVNNHFTWQYIAEDSSEHHTWNKVSHGQTADVQLFKKMSWN